MFSGFFYETFDFMKKLEKNNNKTWFDRNRKKYDKFVLEPATEFVLTVKEFFNYVDHAIVAEPKFNKSFVRINKDMRFAKKPYKDYFLIRFGKKKWDSEFFLVINKTGISYGLFINNEEQESIFKTNCVNNKDLLSQICEEYKINNKFDIYELMKMEKNFSKFNFDKNIDKILEIKYFLIRKDIGVDKKKLFSKSLFTDIIKTFYQLFLIYYFATSENLNKSIKEFSNKIGEINFK